MHLLSAGLLKSLKKAGVVLLMVAWRCGRRRKKRKLCVYECVCVCESWGHGDQEQLGEYEKSCLGAREVTLYGELYSKTRSDSHARHVW